MRPVRVAKNPEVRYRRQLSALTRKLRNDVNEQIIPILRQFESEYVNDAYGSVLSEALDRLVSSYSGITVQAKMIASGFVDQTNQINKRKFYKSLEDVIGVNMQSIIQSENLDDILISTTRENVGLIKSIPDEFFKKIENAVFTGTTQGNKASSLIKEIQKIGRTTEKRAKLIARDQTSKLNSAINQQRQQNLGIEEYVWRTSSDERVRDSHKSKNGKVFRWDSPPKDTGHPGQDIQCRCVAQPIINL